jgi:methylated-DNA-[protein]-cysteine S-methyltransferase
MTNPETDFLIDRANTPIGELIVVADRQGSLRAVDWTDYEERMLRLLHRHYGTAVELEPARDPHGLTSKLLNYFNGDLAAIGKLPVRTGGTAFQKQVWSALREIPCGNFVSYAELARRIGKPNAVRAVGLANGANPVGIVVPCHRVIGSSGSLTGYGGGIHRKRWLLIHEGALSRELGGVDFGLIPQGEAATA